MGKILSILSRPIKNFNVENRAIRAISKEKRAAAPMHKASALELEKILKENPGIVDELAKKDPSHDARLRDVYVSSTEKPAEIQKPLSSRYNPEKPLPLDRSIPQDFEYGIKEPTVCEPGFTTLRNMVKFISDYQVNPKDNNAEKISNQYNLNQEKVSEILQYFGTFEVYIPQNLDKNKNKKKIPIKATPTNIQQLIEDDLKEVEERAQKKETIENQEKEEEYTYKEEEKTLKKETKENQEKKEGQGYT